MISLCVRGYKQQRNHLTKENKNNHQQDTTTDTRLQRHQECLFDSSGIAFAVIKTDNRLRRKSDGIVEHEYNWIKIADNTPCRHTVITVKFHHHKISTEHHTRISSLVEK